jgi:hypothetical protein
MEDTYRITALEDKYFRVPWFYLVTAGTTGTIVAPTGGTFVMNQWAGNISARTSTCTAGQRPTGISAQTSGGVDVTVTMSSNGAWALSAAPSAYPIAIIFYYDVKLFYFDRNYSLDTAAAANLHLRQHAITSTSDHTSTATPGQVLKADSNGLPVDLGTQQANLVFSGPVSGANANPNFRQLVAADIPLSSGGYAGSYLFCEDSIFPLLSPPWHELESQSDGGSVGSHSVSTGNNTWVETDRYVTAALSTTILPGGNWKFILYAHGSIIDKRFQLKAEVYRVDSSGAIIGTVLGTATSGIFMGTSVVGIRADCFISTQTGWNITDRVGVVISGRRTDAEGTLTWYHDKTLGYVSEVTTPITLLHNQMNGLNQGDYLHMTAAQYAASQLLSPSYFERSSLGDLVPADFISSINMGGLWEEDASYNFIPVASPGALTDKFWELDANDDLIPRV